MKKYLDWLALTFKVKFT